MVSRGRLMCLCVFHANLVKLQASNALFGILGSLRLHPCWHPCWHPCCNPCSRQHCYCRAIAPLSGSRYLSASLDCFTARGLSKFSALAHAIQACAPKKLLNRRSATDASLDRGPGNLRMLSLETGIYDIKRERQGGALNDAQRHWCQLEAETSRST